MATPQQTSTATRYRHPTPTPNDPLIGPIEDADNNPFIVQPDTWDTDDVANTRAHHYLRRKIERIKFLIDHPPTNNPWNQVQWDHLHRDLDRWILLLYKAHYNYSVCGICNKQ